MLRSTRASFALGAQILWALATETEGRGGCWTSKWACFQAPSDAPKIPREMMPSDYLRETACLQELRTERTYRTDIVCHLKWRRSMLIDQLLTAIGAQPLLRRPSKRMAAGRRNTEAAVWLCRHHLTCMRVVSLSLLNSCVSSPLHRC